MLRAMRHVGVVVKNLDRMLAFYRDILRLQVLVDFRERGEFIDTVQALKRVDVRMVKLSLPDGLLLELLCDDGHPPGDLPTPRLCDPGVSHVAFTVDDIESAHREFVKRGLETLSEPMTSPDGKARLFFGRDPEGNLLELVEMLAKPNESQRTR